MAFLIDDLEIYLLNIFIFFTLYYFVSKLIKKRHNTLVNEFLITLVSGISIILCMTFSVNLAAGHIFDLRQIPFIVGALYGGRRVAVMLFIILISYRFYIDGSGFYGALYTNSILLFWLWYIIPKFKRAYNIKSKVQLATVTAILAVIIMALVISIFYREIMSVRYISFISLFIITQSIGIMLFISYIERAKKDKILRSEVRRLEKLQAVSEIAASISHEVRNPLTVSKGFLQLLGQSELTEENKNFYIKYSLEELERAEHIITNYLTFAKPSLENIQLLEIEKELEYIISVVNPYANMNNVFIEVNNKHNVYITGDAEKLRQCLLNIIKNSIESIENEGKITISLDERHGMAIILIKDTGVGMNKEQVKRLGTPYFSTKDKGTGLGLMVVFSLIKAMNGKIKVESEIGKGTCFTITIPTVEYTSDKDK